MSTQAEIEKFRADARDRVTFQTSAKTLRTLTSLALTDDEIGKIQKAFGAESFVRPREIEDFVARLRSGASTKSAPSPSSTRAKRWFQTDPKTGKAKQSGDPSDDGNRTDAMTPEERLDAEREKASIVAGIVKVGDEQARRDAIGEVHATAVGDARESHAKATSAIHGPAKSLAADPSLHFDDATSALGAARARRDQHAAGAWRAPPLVGTVRGERTDSHHSGARPAHITTRVDAADVEAATDSAEQSRKAHEIAVRDLWRTPKGGAK